MADQPCGLWGPQTVRMRGVGPIMEPLQASISIPENQE